MTRQVVVALVALVLLIGATVVAGSVVAAPLPPDARFTEEADVRNGTWFCAPPAREGETATVSIAAVDEAASEIVVERIADGASTFEPVTSVPPDGVVDIELEGAATPPAIVVRWRGGSSVASWRVDGDDPIGAACARSPAPRWMIAGADTTLGSRTRVQLFNPFATDAVVRLGFATPEGSLDLVSSENIPVPARSVVERSVGDIAPEREDLGIVVEAQAGRVIASALQRFAAPPLPDVDVEGVEPAEEPDAPQGRTALPAGSVPAEALVVPRVQADADTVAWLSVLNPSDRPTRVAVDVSDPVADATSGEVIVGPSSVQRIPLDGRSSAPSFSVVVRALDGSDISATALVAEIGDARSVAALPAAGTAEPFVAAPLLAPTDGGSLEVAIANPSDMPAVVTVGVAGTVPDAWSAVEVAPGDSEVVAALLDSLPARGPVTVSGDRGVHAALRVTGGSGATVRLAELLAAGTTQGRSEAPLPERDDSLETRPVDFPAQRDP